MADKRAEHKETAAYPDLDAQSGATTFAAAQYILIAQANLKRRWLAVVAPRGNEGGVLVMPTMSNPGGTPNRYGQIPLFPGDSVIFSETGDMPWRGPVYVYGLLGTNTIYYTEAQEWPIT